MASVTLYDLSVVTFIRLLKRTSKILTLGQKYAQDKNIPESQLLSTRLVDDMYPLPFQVQRVSDIAKMSAARIGGITDAPSMPDTETTFEQLQERLSKTVTWLESLPREQIDGSGDREVVHPAITKPFKAQDYLLEIALPNAYFHVSATYALLRHQGVPVGKRDYLGREEYAWKN